LLQVQLRQQPEQQRQLPVQFLPVQRVLQQPVQQEQPELLLFSCNRSEREPKP
jgi:hypothetical protein